MYLPSDIKNLKTVSGKIIKPKQKISFKTTKFNGIWLDIPGAQIHRSNAFILVKLGISRKHFVSFLKEISFVKDKLLPIAIKTGTIDQDEAKEIWDNLPGFKKIPCYIPGFIDEKLIKHPPTERYKTTKKRSGEISGYRMIRYVGLIVSNKPVDIGDEELLDYNWKFESIGTFSQEDHFIASSADLKFKKKDWEKLIRKLTGGCILGK